MPILKSLAVIIFSLAILGGCASKQTLTQREDNTRLKYDILKQEIPSYIFYESIIRKSEAPSLNVRKTQTHSAAVTLPAIAIPAGATSLGDVGTALGVGMLIDFTNYMSEDASLARTQIRDIGKLYVPTVTFAKLSTDNYNILFDEAMSLYRSLTSQYNNCHIIRVLDDDNYAYARTYHQKGVFRKRVLGCSKNGSFYHNFEIIAIQDAGYAKVFLRTSRTQGSKDQPDMKLQRRLHHFGYFDDIKDKGKGWGIFYNGNDPSESYKWMSYYQDKDGTRFSFSPLKYPTKEQNEVVWARINKRIDFFNLTPEEQEAELSGK